MHPESQREHPIFVISKFLVLRAARSLRHSKTGMHSFKGQPVLCSNSAGVVLSRDRWLTRSKKTLPEASGLLNGLGSLPTWQNTADQLPTQSNQLLCQSNTNSNDSENHSLCFTSDQQAYTFQNGVAEIRDESGLTSRGECGSSIPIQFSNQPCLQNKMGVNLWVSPSEHRFGVWIGKSKQKQEVTLTPITAAFFCQRAY